MDRTTLRRYRTAARALVTRDRDGSSHLERIRLITAGLFGVLFLTMLSMGLFSAGTDAARAAVLPLGGAALALTVLLVAELVDYVRTRP